MRSFLPTNKENPEKFTREQTIAKCKQAEEALKQAESHYRNLFDNIKDGFQLVEVR
jgi:hypothetical protein